jgi:uncharacterized iron-regulated protein
MSQRAWLWIAMSAALGAPACAGHYPSSSDPKPPTADKAATGKPDKPPIDIEKSALPMQIVNARTGHQVEPAAFWAALASERAVCVGEEHPNPHHHWVQLEVVKHLAAQPHLALGMEMFQRPFQGVLDDYAAGHIDAAALRSRAGWEDRWGYDWALYAPTIAAVVAAKGVLLALNSPRELTKKVVHHGLESLTPDERAQIPELNLTDAEHRAWFDTLMEEMGGSSAHSSKPQPSSASVAAPQHAESAPGEAVAPAMPSADAIYTVQVIWDETMADTSAKWLAANPQGHLVILAGNGHCHDSAIVNRIKRRGIANVVSVRTVIDDGEGTVAEALVKPINDYIVVLTMPKEMRDAEEKSGN